MLQANYIYIYKKMIINLFEYTFYFANFLKIIRRLYKRCKKGGEKKKKKKKKKKERKDICL